MGSPGHFSWTWSYVNPQYWELWGEDPGLGYFRLVTTVSGSTYSYVSSFGGNTNNYVIGVIWNGQALTGQSNVIYWPP